MERVLPSKDVKARIADLAVGLAADCDRPENDVEKLIRLKFANASTLPFAGFVTHDGKWVKSFSGFKRPGDFLRILASAEQTPYLQATKAVRKKLAGLAATAGKAADRGDWRSVLKAAQAAAKTTGRCPERKQLAALVGKAREWAAGRLDAAVKLARPGGDLKEALAAVGAVKKHLSGEPEAAEAATGLKALRRLARIVKAEAQGKAKPGIREKAAEKYKGTRWASIFEKASATGEPPEGE